MENFDNVYIEIIHHVSNFKYNSIMVSQNLLNFFRGDNLAANVWYNKYRCGEEQTPQDSFERYVEEFAKFEQPRLQLTKEQRKSVLPLLSTYGKERYGSNLLDADVERIQQYYEDKNLLGLRGIIPGGSLLQGIGQHHLYSSLSNCLVLGTVHDSYSGISLKSEELVQTCKRRMGNGLNLSTIRPNGAKIHNQATFSSGVVPVADRFSHLTKEVAQFGRRGACMLNIDINHPDSLEFAEHKQNLSNLTGVNISVILDDEFMDAVDRGDDSYLQRFPIDLDVTQIDHTELEYGKLVCVGENQYVKRVNPVDVWGKIIEFAWRTGEPGLLFKNNWRRWGTDWAYIQFRPISTNPCSEIPMQAYDSCRLMSINLFGCMYRDKNNRYKFNLERLYELAYEQQTLMDVVVDMDSAYIDNIINRIENDATEPDYLKERELRIWKLIKNEGIKGRRTGSGFTGLGDVLMLLGYGYNNKKETMEFLERVFQTKMRAELDATIDMAKLYGTFEGFDFELERSQNNEMFQHLMKTFPMHMWHMEQYGRRNVSWSTAAPTGTLSILAQCSSGIEPMFEPFSFRRVKCTKPTDRVDFIDPADGQKFTVYKSYHFNFMNWVSETYNIPIATVYEMEKHELEKFLAGSPFEGNSANEIDWKSRVDIQSLVQKYTTHAISSTVNLPNDAEMETVSNIYRAASRAGLKGITVFRDGCRAGVYDTGKVSKPEEEMILTERPDSLDAKVFDMMYRNKPYSIVFGMNGSKPYEIFITQTSHDFGPSGTIIREMVNKTKQYAHYNEDGVRFVLNTNEDDELKDTSLYLSMLMRYNVPMTTIVSTLNKTEPVAGTFTHRLVKILSTFIENGTDTGAKCPECGDTIIFENGCYICKSCGHTKC